MYNQFDMKIPKLTKSVAEECIAITLGVHQQQLNFVKLTEIPRVWKHACIPTGVVILTPKRIPYSNSVIDFSVCTACGKVLYHFEEIY
jgi:hypothetical protein